MPRYRTPITSATVLVVAALGLASACGGDGSDEAGTTTAATSAPETTTEAGETTTEEDTTTVETGPSPEVVTWARTWRRKMYAPTLRAGTTFVANASAAVEGNSRADFRVSNQLTRLSNCRLPLEIDLRETPGELQPARRLSRQACRFAFIGVDRFIEGWNQTNFQGGPSAETQAQVRKGIALVKKALKLLNRAERAVSKASAG